MRPQPAVKTSTASVYCSKAYLSTSVESHLKKDSRGLAIKQAKVALSDSALSGAQGVFSQHTQHAGKEDLPPQGLAEEGCQLLISKQQTAYRGSKGCCYSYCSACREGSCDE